MNTIEKYYCAMGEIDYLGKKLFLKVIINGKWSLEDTREKFYGLMIKEYGSELSQIFSLRKEKDLDYESFCRKVVFLKVKEIGFEDSKKFSVMRLSVEEL